MIDQATLQAATTKLLLDSMSAEDKEKLLTTALSNVLTPVRSGGYPYNESSPLQDAFKNAAAVCAGKLVQEYFQTPEVQARVRALVVEAAEKAFAGDFITRLSSKMVDGLWSDR